MGFGDLIQYAVVLALLLSLAYFILKQIGVIGVKKPVITETGERGTKKVKATRSHVLICGPSGSGKTALLNYLGVKEWRETVSSIDITRATFTVSSQIAAETSDGEAVKKSVKLKYVDVPGHQHYTEDLLDSAETASTILLVIDSKIQMTHGQAAEILYEMLNSSRVVVDEQLPIMIVCNKQDQQYAKKATAIEMELEKEIEELKRARVATRDPDREYVGYIESMKGRFEFKNESSYIKFCEASVKDGNVEEILKFIVKAHLK
uniref:Signal recognition particle receptor subunit beta n=1 Tax=Euplotes harpa TaxID=151035 RepID=A0A7S3JAU3_9SPIT|mmetsp:Transcript_25129/g.28920  ORF Transcript_25129/g.28920 Transcript_25129/m.28920 type:complete len:263 (+) Transcript_25129:34-822(+)